MPDSFSFHLNSLDDTDQLGTLIGDSCHGGEVLLLHGELGAGKTTLAQSIARAAGVQKIVNSPTFMIVKEYEVEDSSLSVVHADLYRINDASDLYSTGLLELLGQPNILALVEWPERVPTVQEVPHLDIYFEGHQNTRDARCVLKGADDANDHLFRRLYNAYADH